MSKKFFQILNFAGLFTIFSGGNLIAMNEAQRDEAQREWAERIGRCYQACARDFNDEKDEDRHRAVMNFEACRRRCQNDNPSPVW
jgi:hypothetical protein